MNYASGNYPPQGGYGTPYGNPYQPPPYSPQGPYNNYSPTQYGNQYGGNQGSNQYNIPVNNIYNPSNFRQNQSNNESEYAVKHPQTFQPYPNSPYAPKTMQTNYQPTYKQ